MDSCLRNSEQAVLSFLSFYPSFQKYLLSSVFRYLLLLHTFLRSPKGQQKTRLPVLFQTKKTYADLLIDDQWIYDMFCDTHSDDDIIIHRTDLGFQCIFDREKVLYYYYDEFLLVKNVSGVETEYDPGIEGAHFFLFTEDGHVIMNGGYDAGSFLYVLTLEPSPSKEELKLYCGEAKPIFTSMTSYASYGLFFDNKNRMFLTRFTRMS